jgi:signal transduction histidine kinase
MERLNERRRFSRITDDDLALLVELRPTLERHADAVVEAFYKHLASYDALSPLLSDPSTVARLKAAQREYLLSLCSDSLDAAYVESRLRIGAIHHKIGLSPQWYLGTYCLYLDLLSPLISEQHRADPSRARLATQAMVKRVLLDAQFVTDAYFESREKQAVGRSEHLAAVGQLAASIAHEVRNPLAGMKGALEVMKRQVSDLSHVEVLEEVLGQIGRLEGLVRDLLAYAHPRSIAPVWLSVPELVDRVLRLHQDDIARAGIVVRRTSGSGSDKLHGDPQLMEQVFINLIQNSLQAMETGGALSLGTDREGGELIVTLEDTGKGIPASVLPRVFTPFYTTKHRGSGLGLAIVKKILEQHGGRIEIRSVEGRGTTVTIAIPGVWGDDDV